MSGTITLNNGLNTRYRVRTTLPLPQHAVREPHDESWVATIYPAYTEENIDTAGRKPAIQKSMAENDNDSVVM